MDRILTNPETEKLIESGCPIAIGVSGGKDSTALALALTKYLDEKKHPKENRVLIHSDLGLIEWPESLTWCEKLSERTGTELVTVRREAGDMIDRWETRWKRNWERYKKLESLKVILPWSTPSMRFCTSELKTDIICRALKKRWPSGPILSACGIRAEESPARAKAPMTKPQPKLKRKEHLGWDWNPILQWTLEDVRKLHAEEKFPWHPAYQTYGASRVSCSFCIMAATHDLMAALRHPGNLAAYRRLCELEAQSGFAFQQTKWLRDLAPHLLEEPNPEERTQTAKTLAGLREKEEKKIPKEILFVPGKPWPPRPITLEEAHQIAEVRNTLLAAYGEPAQECREGVEAKINSRLAPQLL